jgi:hypothetical protein
VLFDGIIFDDALAEIQRSPAWFARDGLLYVPPQAIAALAKANLGGGAFADDGLERAVFEHGQPQLLEHPLVRVRHIGLQPASALAPQQWAEFQQQLTSEPPATVKLWSDANPFLLMLVLGIVTALFIRASHTQRLWARVAASRPVLASRTVIAPLLRSITKSIHWLLGRVLPVAGALAGLAGGMFALSSAATAATLPVGVSIGAAGIFLMTSAFAWSKWRTAFRDGSYLAVFLLVALGITAYAGTAIVRSGVAQRWVIAALPLFAVIYLSLPWLLQRYRRMIKFPRGETLRVIVLFLVAVGLYIQAIVSAPTTKGGAWAWLAAIVASLALGGVGRLAEIHVVRRWPRAAAYIYIDRSGVYFTAAVSVLIGVAVATWLDFDWLAEQLAIIVYGCLTIGVALRIRDLYSGKAEQHENFGPATTKPADS